MSLFIVFFMVVRWTIPRFRFDQLMALAWKVLIPMAMANLGRVMVVQGVQASTVCWCRVGGDVAIGAWSDRDSPGGCRAPHRVPSAHDESAHCWCHATSAGDDDEDDHADRRQGCEVGASAEDGLRSSSTCRPSSRAWPRPSGTCSAEGDAAVPRGAAEPAAQLPRRPPAQPRRRGPRQVRRLLHVLDGLPGALHRHRRRPVARGRTARSTRRSSTSTSCAASTAACARRPARATRSS